MAHKRIEIDVKPVDPALFEIMKTIRDSPNSTVCEKQLAIMCWRMGLTLNELLCKLEYGDLKICDDISETPLDRFL